MLFSRNAQSYGLGFLAIENPYDYVNNRIYCHLSDYGEEHKIASIRYIVGIEHINYYTDYSTVHDIPAEDIQWVYSTDDRYVADITIFWMDVYGWHDIELWIGFTSFKGLDLEIRFNILFFDDYYVEPPPDDDDEDEDDDEDTDEDEDENEEKEKKEKKENKNTPVRRRRRRRIGWYRNRLT